MITELKLIAALLDYPSTLTQEIAKEAEKLLCESVILQEKDRKDILLFVEKMSSLSLLEWQQLYCETFDVSPVTSLYLFEHVYGSSTKRGAAMSSLKEMYQDYGLEISNGELPDYLPCYLDFLSRLEDDREALDYLADIKALLVSIREALSRNHCSYSLLIDPLISLAQQGAAHECPAYK